MSIEIKNLSMEYPNKTLALDNISLHIENGVLGLLGQNGAGKTTLMRILTTVLSPSSGCIRICDVELIEKNFDKIRSLVGYLPQDLGLYPTLTVIDSLDYIGGLCGLSKKVRKGRIEKLLEETNLLEHKNKKNKQLSGGMKRRVGLVQAMLTDPKVLIVDEPTAGLDPEERIKIRNLLSNFAKDRTVILSTHVVEDVAYICKELCIMNKGKIKYVGTVDKMLEEMQGHVFKCIIKDEIELSEFKNKYLVTTENYINEGIEVKFISKDIPNIKCYPCNGSIEDSYIYMNNI